MNKLRALVGELLAVGLHLLEFPDGLEALIVCILAKLANFLLFELFLEELVRLQVQGRHLKANCLPEVKAMAGEELELQGKQHEGVSRCCPVSHGIHPINL